MSRTSAVDTSIHDVLPADRSAREGSVTVTRVAPPFTVPLLLSARLTSPAPLKVTPEA